MPSLEQFLDNQLAQGRAYFSKEEALNALGVSVKAFSAAANRLTKHQKLTHPKQGFYLILRPEDRHNGAADPATWIDPLMNYLGIDYRVSLLRAAAFHGSSHQAAMVFQVIVPKQLRPFEIGHHRLQFIYQNPTDFAQTNQPEWTDHIKTDAGFAKVAGLELALLDTIRYFHKAAGINHAAQIVYDIGEKANPKRLASIAGYYENTAIRRLGYLLEHFNYQRQAQAVIPFANKAKSFKPLDPAIKPITKEIPVYGERVGKWKLIINEPVEIDF